MTSADKKFFILFVVAAIFISFRLYNIENPFSTNGIDEGIHLVQARMVADGYNLYGDLGGDQAPLAILVFSLFRGDVMSARYLSSFLFLAAALSSFLIASRLRNKRAGVFVLLMLSLDFTLLRESRLASLDLFSASLLCISALFFIMYIDRASPRNIALASLFLSLSCMAKMIAAPFAIMVSVIFLYHTVKKKKFFHLSLYALSFILPFLFSAFIFTPQELIDGVIFRQTGRGFDLGTKLSFLLFIGPSFIYMLSIKRWDLKNKKIAFLVAWFLSIFVFLMVQGRTFQHHFAYVVFPAAILTAVALSDLPESSLKGKGLLAAFVALNAVLFSSMILAAPHDMAYDVADEIKEITPSGSVIISGNPLVNVLADRNCPPNLTNLAYYQHLPAESSDIIYWLEHGDAKAVVLYWSLSGMEEVRAYLEESGNYVMYKTIEGRGQILFYGLTPKFSVDKYVMYVRTAT
ncbi:MAG: glycosyltransferase family 39 protein [Candidatus Thermoplasmatota archaeon]|nr:glycosyltransferase family 39 protein [Candidatus Thermoplasmatota archaeon]